MVEHDVDKGSAERKSRWWAARVGSGSVNLPLVMVDSGFQWTNGREDFNLVYRRMIEAALSRPPLAQMSAYFQVGRSKVTVTIELTNHAAVPLGYANRATVNALVYEEKRVLHTNRYVRAHKEMAISPDLGVGETATYQITLENVRGINWSRAHVIAFADYQPPGSRAYDMLQTVIATEGVPPTATPTATMELPTLTPEPTDTATPTEVPPTPTEVEPTPTVPEPERDIYLPLTVNGVPLSW